ncbi:hypothetical protein GCM10009551_058530 [Nocardiopsis tropica]
MAGDRFRYAEIGRDVGEQTHRREFGGADAEASEGHRADGKTDARGWVHTPVQHRAGAIGSPSRL